jgi:hypothetical protein
MEQYQHYKTNCRYQIIGTAIHSETYEEMVIYRALYDCEKFGNNRVWTRPKSMFFENVAHNGQVVPRFKLIETTEHSDVLTTDLTSH